MARVIRDAAGRTVQAGDTVGGVTPAPGLVTITGQVIEIDAGRVLVDVATASSSDKELPAAGTTVWLPARRMFLIHGLAVEGQEIRAVTGPLKSMRWSGRRQDISRAARFVGPEDLIAAVAGEDGLTLFLRVNKAKTEPAPVPPGWFLLRPPGRCRARAVDPDHYATAYAPTTTEEPYL